MLDFKKRNNETIKDYKIRLCRNKDVYGLTFSKIADLINSLTGDNMISETTVRRWWKGYDEGFNDATNQLKKESVVANEYVEQRIEAEKARVRFFDQRTEYNKTIREQARFDDIKELFKDKLSNIVPYVTNNLYDRLQINRNKDIIVCLNDIHYGATIDNYWNTYNSDVAKERMEKYLLKIKDIVETHRPERCFVFANGDFISGSIHRTIQVSNRENIVEQIIGVSELVSWFLSELSQYFSSLTFASVSGNHSRLDTKENAPKNERLDDLIPWYVKARLSNIKNISYVDNTIDNTFNVVNIRGKNYLNIHGDYDNIGSVSKIINMIDVPIYCVHSGHLHHNMTDWNSRYKFIMSGSMQGMDDFCVEKRILGKAQQFVCVVDDNGIDCMYDIILQ